MPALVTGVIDAVDVDIDVVFGLKMYKQVPDLALTNHMAFPGAILASKVWWDGQDEATRTRIKEALADVEAWAIDTQVSGEVALLDKLAADGARIERIDTTRFEALAGPIRERYMARDELIGRFVQATH